MEKRMALSDTIADMLTRIRNAGMARKNSVDIPGSRTKTEIAKVLKEEGYIADYKFTEDDKQGLLTIYLKYVDNGKKNAIYEIKRISKPSRRVYTKSKDIEPVYNGLGIAILSTSLGIITDRQAVAKNVGGEILCNIW
jgi:small subunit ribosomal protein S8